MYIAVEKWENGNITVTKRFDNYLEQIEKMYKKGWLEWYKIYKEENENDYAKLYMKYKGE